MAEGRLAEYQRVIDMIADLDAAGISLYKLAMMCDRPYNTVKHWVSTGRLESFDFKLLERIHRANTTQMCEVSHHTTSILAPNSVQLKDTL